MNTRTFSIISLFAIIPMLILSMIFPLAVLSFSVSKIDSDVPTTPPQPSPENSSKELVGDAFSQIPSNGNHPVGDYIQPQDFNESHQLSVIPAINMTQDFLPEDAKAIFASDLSQNGNDLINDTEHQIDINQEIAAFAPIQEMSNEPVVLVLHTHATESFTAPEESYRIINEDGSQTYYYSPSQNTTRNTDNTKNVIHLGEIFTNELNSMGIPTVHCKAQHDHPDYNQSYPNARVSIQEYLEKYPSIKYVVDLHRDSIVRQSGEKIKPLCEIDGQNAAQIMLVMGSGSNHPDWHQNLSLALKFKSVCDTLYPGFSRPVYLRTWHFNQDLSSGAVILEVGTCANTLEEAERAASHAAQVFAATVTQ